MKQVAKSIAEGLGGEVINVIQVSSVRLGDTDIPAKGKGFQAVFSVPAMTKVDARNLVKVSGVVNLDTMYLSIN